MVTGQVPFFETSIRSYRDHHVNTPAVPMGARRRNVPAELDDLVLAMLAKSPHDRPDAEAVSDALLPLVRSEPANGSDDRDPRRPFLRPLAPASRVRPARIRPEQPVPLTVDEALELRDRVGRLVQDEHWHQAIDLLDDVVERSGHNRELQLEMRIELATTLFMADEYTRAATLFDTMLPQLAVHEDVALMRYYAGVSHAETGDVDAAIGYLSQYVAGGDPQDELCRDAMYRLGMMLPVVGRAEDGLRYLTELRNLFMADYGPDSIHVTGLNRRIGQVEGRLRR